MRVHNEDIVEKFTTKSLIGDTECEALYLGHIVNFSIQLVFNGNPNGTFKIQASNDDEEAQHGDKVSTWTDIVGSSQLINEAGNHMWTVENSGFAWVRVVWLDDSSAASASITKASFYAKGV